MDGYVEVCVDGFGSVDAITLNGVSGLPRTWCVFLFIIACAGIIATHVWSLCDVVQDGDIPVS